MERLDALVGRILRETRQRMDGKAGEGVEPPPASGARERVNAGRKRALGEGDRLSPPATVRRVGNQLRREAGGAVSGRSLEWE